MTALEMALSALDSGKDGPKCQDVVDEQTLHQKQAGALGRHIMAVLG